MRNINIIAAVAKNGGIGYKNQLIYHLPDDLKYFKKITSGHTVVMGFNTFKSLPKGPLPNRRNIILTSQKIEIPGAEVCHNIDELWSMVDDSEEIFIIGGASVYKQFIEMADRLYITEIEDSPEEVDVFFPDIDDSWDVAYAEYHNKDEKHSVAFSFVTYEKIKKEESL